jgi:hypothetical protein
VALRFISQVEAWDSRRETITFAGEDAGTRADIVCAVTAAALMHYFDALHSPVELISAFRRNREVIERIASATYDSHGRRGPVVLRDLDFLGRVHGPTLH